MKHTTMISKGNQVTRMIQRYTTKSHQITHHILTYLHVATAAENRTNNKRKESENYTR